MKARFPGILELFKNLSISKFEIYVLVDTGYIFVGFCRVSRRVSNRLVNA